MWRGQNTVGSEDKGLGKGKELYSPEEALESYPTAMQHWPRVCFPKPISSSSENDLVREVLCTVHGGTIVGTKELSQPVTVLSVQA